MDFQQESAQARSDMARIVDRHQYAIQRCAGLTQRMTAIEQEKVELVKAVALIDRAIEVISAAGIGKIEQMVSSGLQLSFNNPGLALAVIKNEGKRGNNYSLEGRDDIKGVAGPLMDNFGGGIWNVAAFLLRIIMIKRFKLAKILVLDESFNNVYSGYLPMVSRLLNDLTKNHGYTIIAITHQPILAAAADRVYEVVPGDSPTLKRLTDAELQGLFPEEVR